MLEKEEWNHLPLIYLGTKPEVEVQGAEESALSSDEFLSNEGESEWEDTEESEINEDDKNDKPSKRCKKPKLGLLTLLVLDRLPHLLTPILPWQPASIEHKKVSTSFLQIPMSIIDNFIIVMNVLQAQKSKKSALSSLWHNYWIGHT